MASTKQGPAAVTRTVTIDVLYKASPGNLSVNNGDMLVFRSLAGQDCTVSFVPTGVLGTSLSVPARGSSQPITIGQNISETVDYLVQGPGGLVTGPYSVTVNNGPLPIAVDSQADASPVDAAIPTNGSLYFDYQQNDPSVKTITVDFTYQDPNAPVFYDPHGVAVYTLTLNPSGRETLTARGTAQLVNYKLTPNPRTGGGGTVKVGS